MNMKFVKGFLICCAVLLLAGCTVRKTTEIPAADDTNNEIKSEISDKINNEITEPINSGIAGEVDNETDNEIVDAFEEVLFRGGSFVSGDEETTMSKVYGEGTEQEMAVENRSYAEVDLDEDGVSEIILTLAMGDSEYPIGYELLHYDGGKILGYYINYRGLMELKTDGSFRQSGGAMDWGVYSLTSFGTQEYTTEPLMRCESAMQDSGELLLRYFVDEAEVTEAEFTEAVSRWESGNDAVFRHISEFGS